MALARALVNQPKVLLLDEPLGALDLKLREQMQVELKALQRELGITFVFVTHDQGEALSMADRVAIFNEGRIVQIGAPTDIYERPRTRFVADFVGSSNVLAPDFAAAHHGAPGAGRACGRRRSTLAPAGAPAGRASAASKARSLDVHYQGAVTRVTVDADGTSLSAVVPAGSRRLAPGDARSRSTWRPAARCTRMEDDMSETVLRGRASSASAAASRARVSDLLFRHPRLLPRPAARPAAALARHRLCRLALRAARPELLLDRRVLRPDQSTSSTLTTYARAASRPANLDIIFRTVVMAAAVTLAAAIIAFPIAYYAARYARGRWKAFFYLAVMLPLWSSYLVRVYAWKLILAKEGIITWLAERTAPDVAPRSRSCRCR